MLSSLHIFVCISLYHNAVSSNAEVEVSCAGICNIANGKINVERGNSIVLKYVIKAADYHTLNVSYDNRCIIQVDSFRQTTLSKYAHPSFIDLDSTAIATITGGYSFSFKVMKLNTTVHQGKTFSYLLSTGTALKKGSLMVNVVYGPDLLTKWTTHYDVNETDSINIKLTLSGNPKPHVTAHLEKGYFEITKSNGASPFTYNIKLKNATRSQCGKNLTLEVLGYKSAKFTSKINVLFTPGVPQNVTASFTSQDCLTVNWKKIESGACSVKYTILYVYNNGRNTFNVTTIDHLEYKHCFRSIYTLYNGTVRVQAIVGRRNGPFSEPVNVKFRDTSKYNRSQLQGISGNLYNSGAVAGIVIGLLVVIVAGGFGYKKRKEVKQWFDDRVRNSDQ